MGNFGIKFISLSGATLIGPSGGRVGFIPPRLVGFASYALGYAQGALIGLLVAFGYLGVLSYRAFSHAKAVGA